MHFSFASSSRSPCRLLRREGAGCVRARQPVAASERRAALSERSASEPTSARIAGRSRACVGRRCPSRIRGGRSATGTRIARRWRRDRRARPLLCPRRGDAGDSRATIGARRTRTGRRNARRRRARELSLRVRHARRSVAAVRRGRAGIARRAARAGSRVVEAVGEAARHAELVEPARGELRRLRPAAIGSRRAHRAGVAGPVVVAHVPLRDARIAAAGRAGRRHAHTDRSAVHRRRADDELRAEDPGVRRLAAAAIGVHLAEVAFDVTPLRLLADRDPGRTERRAEVAAAPARAPNLRRIAERPIDAAAVYAAARRG